MPKTTQKLAESQLSLLQQSLAAFAFKTKTYPPKALQQVVGQAEVAFYERGDFDTVEHLAQVGAARLQKML